MPKNSVIKIENTLGNPLAVQWLGLRASTAGARGSIPPPGTKILHAAWRSQKQQRTNKKVYFNNSKLMQTKKSMMNKIPELTVLKTRSNPSLSPTCRTPLTSPGSTKTLYTKSGGQPTGCGLPIFLFLKILCYIYFLVW